MRKSWLQSLQEKRTQVVLLILLTLVPRLYRITNPVADWHAFRQADTASVTREYVQNGIDLLRPRYHDLSNIQSGLDNLEGYRMVEFPFINGAIASVIRAFPILPVETTSRAFSVLASLGTVLFLYFFILSLKQNASVAFMSGLFFAFLPYSIYYSRVVLPEPFALFFSMGSLFFLAHSLEKKQFYKTPSFWLSAVFLSASFLLKPFVAFLAPLYLMVIIQKQGWKKLLSLSWLFYGFIALAPFFWWRNWILQFPSGIPVSTWLFNSNDIRFRPAWFRWLFYERFTKLILGYFGMILVVPSFFLKNNTLKAILWAWGVGLLTYISVIATGNVQHDYYQVLFIPFLSLALGSGFVAIWNTYASSKNSFAQKIIVRTLIIVLSFLSLGFSWKMIQGYFNVNHWEYVRAGDAVQYLTPPDAKVIAPAFGDTHFLFQTDRSGWPIGFKINEKIEKGATHYVTTSYDDEARELEKKFVTLFKNDEYLILDLKKEKAE